MASGARRSGAYALVICAAFVASACTGADRPDKLAAASTEASPTTTETVPAVAEPVPTTAPPVPTTTAPAPVPKPTTTTTTGPPRVRVVTEQAWTPFAGVGGVTLHHPSRRVERVGFHQSSHEGAQQMDVLPTAASPLTLESRERLTADRTAADVVVDPAVEIRSPVSGRVLRAGTYTLYCKHSDDYVVVEPDGRPGWEVKMLHISGVQVNKGDRVVAGKTVVAPGPTPLPFESQVDKARTADPAWPHVHIEVVDPSIPNKPTPGGGCP